MVRKLSAIAGALATALSGAVNADALNERFSLRGYGTTSVVYSDEDQADFVSGSYIQPEGAGYSDEWSTVVDSKFGLQLDARISDRWSAVVQFVSEEANNNSWDGEVNKSYFPSLEWANVSYKLTDEITLRGGRVVLPFFMDGEFRKVGFARHWVRPPVEVYGIMPFSSSDGGDVSYRKSVGSGVNTLRAHYGTQSLRTDSFKAQAEIWGVNDTFEKDAFTARAAYLSIHWQMPGVGMKPMLAFADVAEMFPSGQTAAAELRRIVALYDPSSRQKVDLFTMGLSYDPGQWFAMGELVRVDSNGNIASSNVGYVSAGYRIGQFTPFITFSKQDMDERNEQIPLAGLPAPLAAMGAQLNAQLDGLVNENTSQQTLAIGMRWDFRSNYALKAQFEHVDLDDGSIGLLTNRQPAFEPGASLNVFTLSLDFVF